MAFGFGFNKAKILSAAEKYVQQGKLQNAITEYEKILKKDLADLTVNNTVGDLYARLGHTEDAVRCFKEVGDAYATQGFTVKAIAMYKKISKLKPSLECSLKLAELYTQQGLFNDARQQYLHVAEEFLRTGEMEQAVRIFQKTLEMDPDNVAMKVRLAEVYVRLDKKTEAWQIFSTAAETLRTRGSLSAAEDILQRMLTLDPGNSYALLLRGRIALESADASAAIQHLEKVADLDSHPDGLRALMTAYLQAGQLTEAGTVAGKLLAIHNDTEAIASFADALLQAGRYQEALQIFHQHAEQLLAANPAKVLESLHTIIGHVRENSEALETLLALFHKAGDNSHINEVTELLAHASVHSGDLEKARDLYLQLSQAEPQNALHQKNYQQVLALMGGEKSSAPRLITAEEGIVIVEELEATAPALDLQYPEDAEAAVQSALTDAELFISYNMPAKALVPLRAAQLTAPRDPRLNQRLAALHTRAGHFEEAAVCCRTLQGLYQEAGHAEEASRYGELAARYEEYVPAATPPAVPAEAAPAAQAPAAPWPVQAPVAAEPAPQHIAEFEVQAAPSADREIDLSAEWEVAVSSDTTSVSAHAHPAAEEETFAGAEPSAPADSNAVSECVEEIRFYLAHSMAEQARDAFARLETLTGDSARLEALRLEMEAATAPTPAAEPESVAEIGFAPTPEPKRGAADEFFARLDSSFDQALPPTPAPQDTGSASHAAPEPEPEPQPVEAVASAPADSAGGLTELVADLEASLGDGFLPGQAAPPSEPQLPAEPELHLAAAAAASSAAAPEPAPSASSPFTYQPTAMRPLPAVSGPSASVSSVDLAEMFGELKHELEEGAAPAAEDPETHYNLGVALREMGLLDEAISELQKVCQAVDHGHPFAQLMQTYTWLAQCFLDKGVPEAAIRWYEQALHLPAIDDETRTALHYELASAYETAHNRDAALGHFMQVYGSNIDYRDVAERIKALRP